MYQKTCLFLVCFSLVGCASNKSLVVSKKNTGFIEGVAYSLPKQLLKVEFKRSPLTVDNLLKGINASKVKIADLRTKKAAKEAEIKETKAFIKALSSSDPAFSTVSTKKSAELLVLKTELARFSKRLVAEKATFDGLVSKYSNFSSSSATVFDQSITFTPQSVTPDPKIQYVARISHKSNFSDEMEIKVKNGLLTGAAGHSEGKNDAIVSAVVGGLSGLIHGDFSFNTPQMYGLIDNPQPPTGCPEKLSVTRIIDPNEAAEITDLNTMLLGCAKIVELKPEFGGEADGSSLAASVNGFVYRQPAHYKIKVSFFDVKASKTVTRTDRVVLAQGPINYISLPQSGFAKNEYDITFSEGALSKSKSVRPSEALAIVSLLPNALKAVFAIPTELLQLKVDYSSKEQTLAETETAFVKALLELDQQQQLLDAQLEGSDE